MSLCQSSYFITNDNIVLSCGFNSVYGQLGLGDTSNRIIPTKIPDLNNVKQVACGHAHTIFLLDDGTIKVCGLNKYGQLGLGDTTDRNSPTLIPDLNNIISLSDYIDPRSNFYLIKYENKNVIFDNNNSEINISSDVMASSELIKNNSYSSLEKLKNDVIKNNIIDYQITKIII